MITRKRTNSSTDAGLAWRLRSDPSLKTSVLDPLIGSAAMKSRVYRPYPSRFQEVLPGVSSGDQRFGRFLIRLSDELEAHLPADAERGIIGGWSRIKTASGCLAKPCGYVMHDNSSALSEDKRTTGFRNPLDERVFNKLCDELFSEADYGTIRVASKSSSGVPFSVYDKGEKVTAFLNAVQPKALNRIFKAFGDRDGLALLEMGLPNVYYQNFRGSADAFDKKRYVASWDAATSRGGEVGLTELDYSIPNCELRACRPRHVMGLNNTLNLLIATWRNGVMRRLYEKFPKTFHHRGPEDLLVKHNEYLQRYPSGTVVAYDVNQFDRGVRSWMFTAFLDRGEGRYFSSEFRVMLDRTLRGCVLQPDTGDGEGPSVHGDWRSLQDLPEAGLLSGHDLVALFGKLLNVFNFLVTVCHLVGYSYVLTHMTRILRGEDPFFVENMGDDELLYFENAEVARKFDEILARPNTTYFDMSKESHVTYLGQVYQFSHDNFRECTILPNLLSFLVHTFVRERPWWSKLNPYWWIGLRERHVIYGQHPAYHDLIKIVDRCWIKELGIGGSFSAYVAILISKYCADDPHIRGFTSWADSEFLRNPDVIHYKVNESDVSQKLIDSHFEAIERSNYEHLIGKHLLSEDVGPNSSTRTRAAISISERPRISF